MAKVMYGLLLRDHYREADGFDEDGKRRWRDCGTGRKWLCDVGVDGTLHCYGSREQIEQLARDLQDRYPAKYRAVPLPWAGEAKGEPCLDRAPRQNESAMNNAELMRKLNEWAREDARIYPDVSTCRFYAECNKGGILNGKHCMMSYVGRDYGAPNVFPKLAVVGMDHRDLKPKSFDKEPGSFADRRLGIEHYYQNGFGSFNRHYRGVVKTAASIFGRTAEFCQNTCLKKNMCQKSHVPSVLCVIDRIAQPNVVKCLSDLAVDGNCKATRTMWRNCARHLVKELEILQPELVIFHGVNAKWSVMNAIKPIVPNEVGGITNHKGEPVLYEWPALGAYLLFLYHPSSRGGLFDREWNKTAVRALNYLRDKGRIPT